MARWKNCVQKSSSLLWMPFWRKCTFYL